MSEVNKMDRKFRASWRRSKKHKTAPPAAAAADNGTSNHVGLNVWAAAEGFDISHNYESWLQINELHIWLDKDKTAHPVSKTTRKNIVCSHQDSCCHYRSTARSFEEVLKAFNDTSWTTCTCDTDVWAHTGIYRENQLALSRISVACWESLKKRREFDIEYIKADCCWEAVCYKCSQHSCCHRRKIIFKSFLKAFCAVRVYVRSYIRIH